MVNGGGVMWKGILQRLWISRTSALGIRLNSCSELLILLDSGGVDQTYRTPFFVDHFIDRRTPSRGAQHKCAQAVAHELFVCHFTYLLLKLFTSAEDVMPGCNHSLDINYKTRGSLPYLFPDLPSRLRLSDRISAQLVPCRECKPKSRCSASVCETPRLSGKEG